MTADYLPLKDYAKLFPFMSYENYVALRVSLETGLRIGDVVALPADCLDKQHLSYTAQKTGKAGSATLSAELADKLRGVSGDIWCFTGKRTAAHRTRQAVWADIKRAAALAGVKGNISPHSARKTFAVDTLHKCGFAATSRALQHSNPSVTMLYAFSDVLSAAESSSPIGGSRDCAGCPWGDPLHFARLVADEVVKHLEGL